MLLMKILGRFAEKRFFRRRCERLAAAIAPLLPRRGRILDVGCGDGLVDEFLFRWLPKIEIEGVDIAARPEAAVPVTEFDGSKLPFEDESFDAVMLVDVLHHTADPMVLLREALRVTRRDVIVKDHTQDGFLARQTLSVMDWLGNAHHGVPLPYNFWTQAQWRKAIDELGVQQECWKQDLRQYPPWIGWIANRQLHMVVQLRKKPEREPAPAGATPQQEQQAGLDRGL
jgi:SAM-dependent methyltransferase